MGYGDALVGVVEKLDVVDGAHVVSFTHGDTMSVEEDIAKRISPGDLVEFQYYHGLLRGVCINAVPIFFESDETMEERVKVAKDALEKERDAAFTENKDKLLEDIAALPQYYKDQIEKSAAKSKNFLRDAGRDAVETAKAAADFEALVKDKLAGQTPDAETLKNTISGILEDKSKAGEEIWPDAINWAVRSLRVAYNISQSMHLTVR